MLKFLFDQQVYAPGSAVKGKLLVTLYKKVHVKHIKISIIGRALLTNWSDDPFANFNSAETYLDIAFYLWRKDDSVKDDGLCPGNHEFPFEFSLPPSIPSTFKDVKGRIEYTCKAWMPSSGVFGRDYGLAVIIPVCRKIILPAVSLHDPQYTDRDVAGGLFKSSGRIKLSVELPRSGYLLGEVVPISGNIMNTSTSFVRLCAYLIQHVAYTNPKCPQAKRQAHYTKLITTIGQFSSTQNTPWTSSMVYIPDYLPPTGATGGCQFFAISYSIKVFMFSSGTAKNASVTFDITVGNHLGIPQTDNAQSTFNTAAEWYEQTVDFNDTSNNQPTASPFYLGGATGEDPLVATGSFSESTDLLLPKPTTLSAADTDPTLPLPSYHDLFPDTIGENSDM
jgi:hypothetical protein